jgi:hypothetical protein
MNKLIAEEKFFIPTWCYSVVYMIITLPLNHKPCNIQSKTI